MSDFESKFYGFDDKRSIENDFHLASGYLDNVFIVHAEYNYGDYCGDAHVLYIEDGELYEVHGSHCSCYGLEDQWDPEHTVPEAAIRQTYFAECDFLKAMVADSGLIKRLKFKDTEASMSDIWNDKDEEALNAMLERKAQEDFISRLADDIDNVVANLS